MSQSKSLTIRIKADRYADWTVDNVEQLTFNDVLKAFSQVCPTMAISSFDYIDYDADRITVRCDEEVRSMVLFHFSNSPKDTPLVVYPKVTKSLSGRNINRLKINTANEQIPDSDVLVSTGSNKRSSDLREILAKGNIIDSDIKHLELLGRGSCGSVYKCIHLKSNHIMAVKVISLDISEDQEKRNIISELEVLHQCHSDVIIAFYGAYFLDNRISVCAEYMDGGSLDQYSRIPENILGVITSSIVEGLVYLWRLKIMHRDVKPSNVLVNTKGQIKLCDFGVSVQLINSIAETYIGTNAYMAPERIQGGRYGVSSEVWSLGLSVFELASGRFPYKSATNSSKLGPQDLIQIVQQEPPTLDSTHFSPALVDFTRTCLQKDTSVRPTPNMLMVHPFVRQYRGIENRPTVALWVNEHIKLKRTSQS